MVKSTLQDKVKGNGVELEAPDASRTQELEETIEDAELETGLGRTETTQWFYWVPFPGVRYYSYRASPSPVEDAKSSKQQEPPSIRGR